MDLGQALAAIRRNRIGLLLLMILGLVAGAGYALISTPQYESSTSVIFSLEGGSSVKEVVDGGTYMQQLVPSYAELVTMPIVLQPVIDELGLATTPNRLAKQVSVQVTTNAVIVEITVTDSSPARAAQIADRLATQLGKTVTSLSPQQDKTSVTVRVTTVSPATVASSPVRPVLVVDVLGGLIGALALGVLWIYVRATLSAPVTNREAVARITEIPVIGTLPTDARARVRPLPVDTHPYLPRAESFRMLRTNLSLLQAADSMRCLAVVSATSGDGRTSTAANLAITISHTARRVLLIDADLRSPGLTALFGLDAAQGLSTVLSGQSSFGESVQRWARSDWDSHALHILPSGPVPVNPSELLASERMRNLLKVARGKYDLVILDSAPLLSVTDGAILASRADGAILLVDSQSTDSRSLGEALSRLDMAGATPIGVVLNRVAEDSGQYRRPGGAWPGGSSPLAPTPRHPGGGPDLLEPPATMATGTGPTDGGAGTPPADSTDTEIDDLLAREEHVTDDPAAQTGIVPTVVVSAPGAGTVWGARAALGRSTRTPAPAAAKPPERPSAPAPEAAEPVPGRPPALDQTQPNQVVGSGRAITVTPKSTKPGSPRSTSMVGGNIIDSLDNTGELAVIRAKLADLRRQVGASAAKPPASTPEEDPESSSS